MSHLNRATRRDAHARRSKEDLNLTREANRQMMAEAEAYMMGDEEPQQDAGHRKQPARRPQGME